MTPSHPQVVVGIRRMVWSFPRNFEDFSSITIVTIMMSKMRLSCRNEKLKRPWACERRFHAGMKHDRFRVLREFGFGLSRGSDGRILE